MNDVRFCVVVMVTLLPWLEGETLGSLGNQGFVSLLPVVIMGDTWFTW